MGFLFFLAIVGGIIYVSTQSAKGTQQKWQSAATNLGLAYYGGGFGSSGSISGERSGHHVTISTHTKGSGNTSKTYTKYLVEYRTSLPLDLRMTRQGAIHTLGKVFGLQDIEVGNPRFDDRVIVRGAQPEAVKRFLTPKLQDTILSLVSSYADITISNEHVVVNKSGKDVDPGIICHCVRRLESFCNEMVDAQHASAGQKHTYKIKEQPPAIPVVERTVPPIPEVIPAVPDLPQEEPIIEIEIEEPVAEPVVVAEPPPLEEDPEPVESIPPEPLEVNLEEVATALYGGDSGSSLLTSKIFAEQYKDRFVTGTGTLKRVSKFSYDPVFPNCTGVKATFDVLEIAGTYSKVKVMAEVKFPTEEYDALKSRVGTSRPIAGTLIAQDAMMSQVYIVAAE